VEAFWGVVKTNLQAGIGFIEGYVLFPFGFAAFLDVVFLTALVVWLVAPKWLR
jgi:hypothetical protein